MPDLSDLITAAVVRPGDYLVVGLPEGFGTADCEQVLAMLREQLPGVNPIVLAGVTSLAVRPADHPAVLELIARARAISDSDRMTVYVADLEAALGLRPDVAPSKVGQNDGGT